MIFLPVENSTFICIQWPQCALFDEPKIQMSGSMKRGRKPSAGDQEVMEKLVKNIVPKSIFGYARKTFPPIAEWDGVFFTSDETEKCTITFTSID